MTESEFIASLNHVLNAFGQETIGACTVRSGVAILREERDTARKQRDRLLEAIQNVRALKGWQHSCFEHSIKRLYEVADEVEGKP